MGEAGQRSKSMIIAGVAPAALLVCLGIVPIGGGGCERGPRPTVREGDAARPDPSPETAPSEPAPDDGSVDVSATEPGPPPPAPEPRTWPNDASALGINLAGVIDWSSELPFVDMFRRSRKWISQQEGREWGKGDPLELDPDGWVKRLAPGQRAETFLSSGGNIPGGTYVCLYEGRGEIDFRGAGRVTKREPGRLEVDVTPGKGSWAIRLARTNPDDHIRNIRVIMPGFEDTYEEDPFWPPFLERTGRFKVIRFMDWMKTNNSEVREWADRPTPAYVSQGHKGVAVEHMIDLSNRLHADPWFCMPHLASDDYVRKFAEMARERLDPPLRVYVEYSNEVWNGQFRQQRWAGERGLELKLADKHWSAAWRYYSQRSVEIFAIWEKALGGTDRLVRVLASQSANPYVSKQIMDHREAFRHADALAIAPYFGGRFGSRKTADEIAKLSVDEILDRCRGHIAEVTKTVRAQVEAASERGLEVIAYEGGQHLVGHGGAENNKELKELFHAANRHPRMRDLYLEYLAGWREAGGRTFAVFSSVGRYSKWGSWGMMEHEFQPPHRAPKLRAVMEFSRDNPRWWDAAPGAGDEEQEF
ncbi:MAG: hypothetical protein ACYTKD_02795 [Planctomycetota bacterium]